MIILTNKKDKMVFLALHELRESQMFDFYYSPTEIGVMCGQPKEKASAFVYPVLKRLLKNNIVLKSHPSIVSGYYKINPEANIRVPVKALEFEGKKLTYVLGEKNE